LSFLQVSGTDVVAVGDSNAHSLSFLQVTVSDAISTSEVQTSAISLSDFNNLKIMSLKLNQQLAMSISYSGDTLPIELMSSIPTSAPPSGKGMVLYVSGGTLKIAAWTGAAWVTT
jgi:hypothetical protein